MSFIAKTSDYVRAVHIHDNDGMADTHLPITPNSWVLDILKMPEFNNIPLIIEAKFDSIQSLSSHAKWLKNTLTTNN